MKITRWLADMKPSTDDIKAMLEEEGLDLEVESYEPPMQVKEHFQRRQNLLPSIQGAKLPPAGWCRSCRPRAEPLAQEVGRAASPRAIEQGPPQPLA